MRESIEILMLSQKMSHDSSIPPIASSHGGGESSQPRREVASYLGPKIPVRLSFEGALRYAYTEFCSPWAIFAYGVVMYMGIAVFYSRRGIALFISPVEFGLLCLIAFCLLVMHVPQ